MTPTTEIETEQIEVGRLYLDPTNPRLAGHSLSFEQQDEILLWLWREKAVDEIVASIASSGYWRHEELFACEEFDCLVVVEGNRRLAAVKLLLDADLRNRLRIRSVPEISQHLQEDMQMLPVIIRPRSEIWDYVGFKHVHGPQAWDSIAKAQYIHRVRTEFGVSLDIIANTIGDKHDTVTRLYRGFLVLTQAQERCGFDPDDSYKDRFPFSHLWTALGYTNVQNYLGVDSEALLRENPVPEDNIEALSMFMIWLFGSKQQDIAPRVKRQNPDLRQLAEALGSERAIAALSRGLDLATAHEVAKGDNALFSEAVINAELSLREAARFIATGYSGSEEMRDTMKNILRLARHLLGTMESLDEESD